MDQEPSPTQHCVQALWHPHCESVLRAGLFEFQNAFHLDEIFAILRRDFLCPVPDRSAHGKPCVDLTAPSRGNPSYPLVPLSSAWLQPELLSRLHDAPLAQRLYAVGLSGDKQLLMKEAERDERPFTSTADSNASISAGPACRSFQGRSTQDASTSRGAQSSAHTNLYLQCIRVESLADNAALTLFVP